MKPVLDLVCMVAGKTCLGNLVHIVNILDYDIDAPSVTGVLKVEIGLHFLDFYQEMFTQDLDLSHDELLSLLDACIY